MFQDAVEQGIDSFDLFKAVVEPAVLTRSVKGREIQLFFRCVEVEEEFEHCVVYFIRTTVWFVDLVDDHDRMQVEL